MVSLSHRIVGQDHFRASQFEPLICRTCQSLIFVMALCRCFTRNVPFRWNCKRRSTLMALLVVDVKNLGHGKELNISRLFLCIGSPRTQKYLWINRFSITTQRGATDRDRSQHQSHKTFLDQRTFHFDDNRRDGEWLEASQGSCDLSLLDDTTNENVWQID